MKYNILNTKNYYETYFLDDEKRDVIIIAPGGGYKYTSKRESLPVVNFYKSYGYHCVVVNYREDENEYYPLPQKYLAYAINEVRNDKRSNRLIGLGFSAGGHNILEVSNNPTKYGFNSKLDLLMLAYPVITSDERYWHKGSFENLLGPEFKNKKLLAELSLENTINPNSIDLFLWGTFTDESVPVMNSLLLLEAYNRNGCNVEYHAFPFGQHGLSMCNNESAEGNPKKISPYISRWALMSIDWLNLKLKK